MARRTPRQRGFSFIEVLIVMGIIGVLVAGALIVVQHHLRTKPRFVTQVTLQKASGLIGDWKLDFDAYPPSDVTRIAVVARRGPVPEGELNALNRSVESVHQALAWTGFRSDAAWEAHERTNVDGDRLRRPINKHGTTELFEIADAWGSPLVYFRHDDYRKHAQGGVAYLVAGEDGVEREVRARPYRNDDGTFANPSSFQIYSMGPDREPNTDDDVLTWSN